MNSNNIFIFSTLYAHFAKKSAEKWRRKNLAQENLAQNPLASNFQIKLKSGDLAQDLSRLSFDLPENASIKIIKVQLENGIEMEFASLEKAKEFFAKNEVEKKNEDIDT